MSLHLKTSVDYIKRAPFQAGAAISVLAVTFFVATLLSVLVYGSSQVLRYFETRPQIIAFLKKDAPDEGISALQRNLMADTRIKDVKYVSKEEALEIYKKATADNPLLAELVSPTIFPASLEFSAADLSFAQSIIDEVKQEGVVESVGFTASIGGEKALGEVVERLKNISYYIRVGGLALILVLMATSFLVLLVVISMRIATRKGEIETLSLIGATSGFIRAPIVLEAIMYSVIGVLLGWLFAIILILYLTPSIMNYFADAEALPRDTLAFFGLLGIILAVELVIGMLIALSGAFFAVSRSLKK